MILKNDILASKGEFQGIYRLDKTLNGKAIWKSNSNAIWFNLYGVWMITAIRNIETMFGGIGKLNF